MDSWIHSRISPDFINWHTGHVLGREMMDGGNISHKKNERNEKTFLTIKKNKYRESNTRFLESVPFFASRLKNL